MGMQTIIISEDDDAQNSDLNYHLCERSTVRCDDDDGENYNNDDGDGENRNNYDDAEDAQTLEPHPHLCEGSAVTSATGRRDCLQRAAFQRIPSKSEVARWNSFRSGSLAKMYRPY